MDNLLIRRALQCPPSTRKESYNLELGLLPISAIIMARRVNYLQYIVKSDENGMLKKFFQAQYDSPSQGDWTEQARIDLKILNIEENFETLKEVSKAKFKKTVKIKTEECALDQLNEKKFEHSKMENVIYTELKIQDYLTSRELTTGQKRIIFKYRMRMADFSENFRGSSPPQPCRMCNFHRDSQTHSVICYETLKNVTSQGNYNEIFTKRIKKETAEMLEEITKIRKNKLILMGETCH